MVQRHDYCTLFSSNFITRGFAMVSSLLRHSPDSTVYVLCLDPLVKKLIEKEFSRATVVPVTLEEFESEELLELKRQRTLREYCWTCTPYIIHHCITKYNLPSCTYLDADLYFYSSPQPLHDELVEKSVSIIPHRYTPGHDHSKTSGIYCVQFMTFKNNAAGMEVLLWWRNACRGWCHEWFEDGKFGDQKYLDDWPERFQSIRVLSHLGGGVAPWNCQQYKLERDTEGRILINHQGQLSTLIFYHFHGVKFYQYFIDLGGYSLSSEYLENLYRPYIRELHETVRKFESYPFVNLNNQQNSFSWNDFKYLCYKFLHGKISILPVRN